jgi:microsomal prostaglandin-E synthase 2
MYGMLTAMEGTEAFKDMLSHTKMKPWFERTKTAVNRHAGAKLVRK